MRFHLTHLPICFTKDTVGFEPAEAGVFVVKPLRESGLIGVIEIVPNAKAAVIYREGTNLEDVLESIHIIARDLEHQLKIQGSKK